MAGTPLSDSVVSLGLRAAEREFHMRRLFVLVDGLKALAAHHQLDLLISPASPGVGLERIGWLQRRRLLVLPAVAPDGRSPPTYELCYFGEIGPERCCRRLVFSCRRYPHLGRGVPGDMLRDIEDVTRLLLRPGRNRAC